MSKKLPDPIEELRVACRAAGSQAAFARKHGLEQGYISLLLSGARAHPGPKILAALGLVQVIDWKWRHREPAE